jgi:hypothetical protein
MRQRDRQVAGVPQQPEVPGKRVRSGSTSSIREISTVQPTEQVVGKQVTGPDGGQWTSLAARW